MGRLVNEARIKHSFKPENLGKLLIFVEGSTEYNYIDYLKEYYENNKCSPYTDMVIEQINTSGNAKGVYNRAEEFLQDENNSRVYRDYEKHLVFDCDAPEDIQEVINLMLESENNYILDYSNLLFETWLLMHFYEVLPDENNGKRDIIHEIADALCLTYYGTSEKADPGTIKKILATDGNNKMRNAIANAKSLENHWKEQGFTISNNIEDMNPSAGIHELIERLLDEIEWNCK